MENNIMFPLPSRLHYKDISNFIVIISITLFAFISFPGNGFTESQPVLQVPAAFVSDTVKVNGAVIRYVKGGKGPAIVLLHGWPQDWSEFKGIMPALAKNFTVVAIDLRGIGGSVPESG